ncbi:MULTISPECIES: type IV pilus secretin family protein [unclassified Okeania]|uniref:type IV pilus secretin family protein n=1 Tax=unclassified Okeania TaxID=2634635 RepID=UPI0013BDFB4A|nr:MULTISPECIES: type IV pilus secretin family protein [unclassified Okeania]NES74852.1 AMIN domain-containing protein [Okeania sp. SIO1H4]NES90040.1 AMIN domain-containing protein [Okeania sp. SIO2B9]NET20824.1 AMIN domain-containing protein [Okeania sp. SIO1H5]NET75118.1 AMIN domain-containing protein [Okeania sp. SIO1F9]NET91931.1 AMIN domain-containing protein [Okeania sp. SIO1H2]
MKQQIQFSSGLLGGVAAVIIAQTPAFAVTQITQVQLNSAEGGMNIVLVTNNGDRPEVFSVNRDNSFVADIINAQLRIPEGNKFRKDSPAPGIKYVEVMQVDANSVRVVIQGTEVAPRGRIIQGGGRGIILSAAAGSGEVAQASTPKPNSFPPPSEASEPAPPPVQPEPTVVPPRETTSSQESKVLLPDSELTGDGFPTLPGQPSPSEVPPFQPRAIAPPVGDIAISNINPSVEVIDLGTQERIPRLVLRDAPVRDVLALLARAAGLNVAFSSGGEEETGPSISLDIENESVQDVFNYVLRLSGLQANRVGNTVFVGQELPAEARNVVVRSFRLNQVTAQAAAGFLVSMGAESAVVTSQPVTQVNTVNIPGTNQAITNTETIERTVIQPLRYDPQDAPPLLKGLQVVTDSRLNSVTLVGPPQQVEIAAAQLVQLDLRQRQVAVNVKVIDINLSAEENLNSSFSFGVNDSFFINDNGAASLNFGSLQPASITQQNATNPLSRPVTGNPILGDPFFDSQRTFEVPGTGIPNLNQGRGTFLRPIAPTTSEPTRVGIDDYEPSEIDVDNDGVIDVELGEAEFGLFPQILYPRRFLGQLRATVRTGNAKILTDPTLVVQEGEIASVRLVENIVRSIDSNFTDDGGTSRETRTVRFEDVGLTLAIQVERIDDNGFVTVTVNPEVSFISNRVPTDADNQSEFGTEIARRRVESGRIRLRDGQTLIISGIIQEQERTIIDKVPILGDLPIIGSLFRSSQNDNQRAETIVLLTPQILDDGDRSSWGYRFNPSPDALQMMERGQPRPR